jgi:hypothetical protein
MFVFCEEGTESSYSPPDLSSPELKPFALKAKNIIFANYAIRH